MTKKKNNNQKPKETDAAKIAEDKKATDALKEKELLAAQAGDTPNDEPGEDHNDAPEEVQVTQGSEPEPEPKDESNEDSKKSEPEEGEEEEGEVILKVLANKFSIAGYDVPETGLVITEKMANDERFVKCLKHALKTKVVEWR